MPKIEQRAHVVWLPHQDLAIVPGGSHELTLIDERGSETKERLRMTRHLRQNAREDFLRFRGIAAIEADRAQEDVEIRHGRSELLPAPQHSLGIGEPTQLPIGRSKLLERWSKHRPARGGALEPGQ